MICGSSPELPWFPESFRGLPRFAAHCLKLAAKCTTGNAQPFAFSLGNAEYILSFGSNLVPGHRRLDTCTGCHAPMDQKGATKLVQVESRCSMTASKADQFLAVNPGKEALLALGIAHVMVTGGTYDADFVKTNVFGFEELDGQRRQEPSGIQAPGDITGLLSGRGRKVHRHRCR